MQDIINPSLKNSEQNYIFGGSHPKMAFFDKTDNSCEKVSERDNSLTETNNSKASNNESKLIQKDHEGVLAERRYTEKSLHF